MAIINSGCVIVVVLLAFALLPIFFSFGAGRTKPSIVGVPLALTFVVLFAFASILSFMSFAAAGESGLDSVAVFNFVVIGPLWGAIAALSLSPRPKRAIVVGVFAWLLSAGCVSFLGAGLYAARTAPRRSSCANNLKQIGLAMQQYEAKYGCFPPAYIPDENGKPKHSWRVLILPFLGYKEMYDAYHFDEPWNGPHNMVMAECWLNDYLCPSDPTPRTPDPDHMGKTNYVMLVGPHAISDGPTARRKADITNGLGNTIMVIEVVGADINWLEPRDLDVSKMTFHIVHPGKESTTNVTDISSGHPSSANVLMCDGTVRSLPDTIDPGVLKAMTTIDGGQTVNMDALNR